jgi:hypothetical protein
MSNLPPPYPYAAGDLPPQRYSAGPALVAPAKRSGKTLGIAIALAMISLCLLGLVFTIIMGTDADRDAKRTSLPSQIEQVEPSPAPEGTPATPTAPAKPKPVTLEAGTYEVGKTTDVGAGTIAAGTWKISTPADGLNCYWSRLKNFDGELTSIRANGNVAPGSTARVTLKATDKGLELLGDCRARR